MMQAVWSFWSKPYLSKRSWIWLSDLHHLLAWVLSVETARRHYPRTALVTDDEGAAILADGIGLHFDEVSTVLEDLPSTELGWWGLGKLFAYRAQEVPFVHIDADCFLWNALPDRLASADVFGQNLEWFPYDGGFYGVGLVEAVFEATGGWMPEELRWFMSVRGSCAVNCGIFGGHRLDFIRHYADRAIGFLRHPANQPAWPMIDTRTTQSIFAEQYLLNACIEYHRGRPGSEFSGIEPEYLFQSMNDAVDPAQAKRAGFTHLMGLTKLDEEVGHRLRTRVVRDYPELAERCAQYVRYCTRAKVCDSEPNGRRGLL